VDGELLWSGREDIRLLRIHAAREGEMDGHREWKVEGGDL